MMKTYLKFAAIILVLMMVGSSASALAVSTSSKSVKPASSNKTIKYKKAIPVKSTKSKKKKIQSKTVRQTSPFLYEGWLPYWKKVSAAGEVSIHLNKFQEISPFSYEVNADGIPVDKLKIQEGLWPNYLLAVRDLRIKIIPTIAWLDGNAIHNILADPTSRQLHISQLVALAKTNNFDGLDIDYENKKSETNPYFSQFLQELATKLHSQNKTLTCSIEPRTPPSSQFTVVPTDTPRANDYNAINQYCDEVRVMAYDQRRVDLLLNQSKGSSSQTYIPIADPDWVAKVLQETTQTIKPGKIVLGIPTYGHQYVISEDASGTRTYTRAGSITYSSAIELAKNLGVTPTRNSADELSFTYAGSSTSATGTTSTNLVWFSDAPAMADKINLAKKQKLRGVAFFKFDGETDPAIWNEIK